MKIKLEQMVMAMEPLQRIFLESLPIRTTFRLKKIVKLIDENLKDYNESRLDLLKKYGVENPETGGYDIPEENRELIEKEHTELLNTEVSLAFEPLSIDLFGNIQISGRDATLLEWIIVE
jgi:hypothetical protein